MSKLQRRGGLLIAVVALAGVPAPAASDPPAEKAASDPLAVNKQLAREQIEMARQALKDLDLLHQKGEVPIFDPQFPRWMRREVKAVRASGADKAEMVAALEGYVKRLKDLATAADAAFKKDLISRIDVADAKYRVLEAEMWLNRVKAQ
jgi:hypothetical protein